MNWLELYAAIKLITPLVVFGFIALLFAFMGVIWIGEKVKQWKRGAK